MTDEERKEAKKNYNNRIKDLNQNIKWNNENPEKEPEENPEYIEPLAITLHKEIRIELSTGGPADGYKLIYYDNELQNGVYYFANWGTYEEIKLNEEELQQIEDFYLYGQPETILNEQ